MEYEDVRDETMDALLKGVAPEKRGAVPEKIARLRERLAEHEQTKTEIDALVTSLGGSRKSERRPIEERVAAALGMPFKDIVACRRKAQIPALPAPQPVPFEVGPTDVPVGGDEEVVEPPEEIYPPPELGP